MQFEPFSGLRLGFGLLLLLFFFAGGLEIWLFRARHRGWTPVMWLPIAGASAAMSLTLLRAILEPSGSGPEGGFHAMGKIFALMFGWPVLFVFAGALWAFPRRWNVIPTIGGIAITAGAAITPFYVTTESLTLQVIGADGKPIPNVTLQGETTRDGRGVKLGSFTTDEQGRFQFRFSPHSPIRFATNRSDDFFSAQLEVAAALDRYSQPVPEQLRLMYWWGLYGPLSHGCSLEMSREGNSPVPFFLKPKEHLVFLPLQERIRRLIEEAKQTGAHAGVLENACRNVESFDLVEEIAAIISVQPQLHNAAIGGLRYSAEMLGDLNELRTELMRKNQISRWGHADKVNFTALCEWANTSATEKPSDAMAAIERKLKSHADTLIRLSRPYWTEESHSVAVLDGLGTLGKPAIGMMPEALPRAHPRARKALLRALERFAPTVADVDWFITSNDPELVVAGYEAAKRRVFGAEVPLAMERLRRFNKPGSGTLLQMQIEHLLAVLNGPPDQR